MRNLFKTKKAGTKLLSVWWFLVLVIIAIGIVAGTSIFITKKIDTRAVEADILVSRAIICLVNQGIIREDFLKENFNIFQKCALSEKIIDKSSNYFLNISLFDATSNKLVNVPLVYGNHAFEKECKVPASGVVAPNFPRCSEKSLDVIDSSGNKFKLNIIAGSNYEYRGA